MNRSNRTRGSPGTEAEFLCSVTFITRDEFELFGGATVLVIISAISIPLCLVTTLANLLVIISIWRTPSLHSPSNILLVGLALSDLGVGLVTFPASIISNIAKLLRGVSLFCEAYITETTTGNALCAVSLLTLAAISLDHFIAIHYHLRYREIVTIKRTVIVLVFMWFYGGASALFYCINPIPCLLLNFAVDCTCVITVMVVSFSLSLIVRRHQREIAAQMQAQLPTVKEGSLILPLFIKSFVSMQVLWWSLVVCYTPVFASLGSLIVAGSTPGKQRALDIALLLLLFNSTINPFLYCWRYRHIRDVLRKLMRQICCQHTPTRWRKSNQLTCAATSFYFQSSSIGYW